MKLQVKLAIYNALSKALIIAAFGFILPLVAQQVVFNHIDKRLIARSDRVLKIISRGGIEEIIMEQDCSFESYNILKEEFVAIFPLSNDMVPPETVIFNEDWNVGGENLSHRIIKQAFVYDNQLYQLNIGEGLGTIEKLNQTIVRFTLAMMIILILISVFMDVAFVRIMLRPFNRIVRQKLQLPQNPANYSFEEIKTNTYEFNYLDSSINSLMKKTKDAFLIEKEFIANVAHELLTPISILQNRLENMLISNEVPEKFENKIIESQKTLMRLSKIIKALLMISKIENDQYIKQDEVQLPGLIDDVLAELEERIDEKQIEVIKEMQPTGPFRPCNRSLLFNMFFNLVNNAIKYNNIHGKIEISGWKDDECYHIRIRDEGIGIDKEQAENIFDRFKRFHPGDGDGQSYGLGLPIVKTIADFHRVDIKVDTEQLKGTSFTLTFPIGMA
jgi:signal transduction histidine kinase